MSNDKESATVGLLPILAAITGNIIITIAKFIGFMLSGSATLFAEVIHSVADVSNQALLYVGVKRSLKAPDETHVYGYGQERFFWAVVSACGVFFIGAGVTVYHGIHSLMAEASEVHVTMMTVGLLIFSLLIELVSVGIAVWELKQHHPSLMAALKKGDPSTIAIVYEDGVALLGILIALASLYLTKVTGVTYWDGIGSIVVGLLLGGMAIVLVNKNRAYLIEKAMPAEAKEKIIKKLQELPIVDKVVDFKSTTVSLDEYRIKFDTTLNSKALIDELYKEKGPVAEFAEVNTEEEFLKHSSALAHRVTKAVASHVRHIEEQIKETVPEVKHIDIVVR